MHAFRRRRNGRGQSMAEFALVAPIFFLLVFSVIQFGLIMAAQNGLVDGVRNAARRAATYRINEQSFDPQVFSSICTTIEQELDAQLADRVIGYSAARVISTIVYEWEANPETNEWFLVAHVDASFDNLLYVPLVSHFLDNSDDNHGNPGVPDGFLTLSASEQMRVENPALEKTEVATSHTCP